MAKKATATKAKAEAQPAAPAKGKTEVPTITAAQTKKCKALETTSAKIRYLDSQGYKRGPISKILTAQLGKLIRYQHVRNVLVVPITTPKS